MLECPGLQKICYLLFRVKAFTWPWEAGLCCPLPLAQCKQAAPPGSVTVVRKINLFLKQVGMKAGMADGAGSSRS